MAGGRRLLCLGDFFFWSCFFFLSRLDLFFIFCFFFRPRGLRGALHPFPSRPESGFSGWGRRAGGRQDGAWAWPVARAGGAVLRRPPSSLAARVAPGARGAPEPGAGPPGPEDGAEAAETPPSRPQTQKAGSPRWGLKGAEQRWWRFAFSRLSQAENRGMWSGSLVDGVPPCLPSSPPPRVFPF